TDDRLTARRREEVCFRIRHRVRAVFEVAANLPATTRNDLESGSPGECKAGAESEPAGVRCGSEIAHRADAAFHFRHDVVPALAAGEPKPETQIRTIQRAVDRSELAGRRGLRRIDQAPVR